MKTLPLAMLTATLGLSVQALTLNLDGIGNLKSPETGLSMSFTAAKSGWRGNYSIAYATNRKGAKIRFPDMKTNAAYWALDEVGLGRTKAAANKPGVVDVAVDFAAKKSFDSEQVMWSVRLPLKTFAGGKVVYDGKKTIKLPEAYVGNRMSLGAGDVTEVRVVSKAGEEYVFSFASKAHAMVQDNRRFKGDSFSLRLYGKKMSFAEGDKLHYAFSMTDGKDALELTYDKPLVIASGKDWVPVDFKKNIVPGSALDLSEQGLQDAPAGKYGWTKIGPTGHFEFEKLPGVTQRFYGVNLCFSANYVDHALSDEFVERLVRSGYNSLRVHHYERDLMLKPGSYEFNPDQIDKFDYLMAKAINAGLYVTTDIFVSRPITWAEIGLPERGKGLMKEKSCFKHLVALWDPAFESWKKFAKALLCHVNPYTGRSYLNEPALNLISLVNEGQLSMHWGDSKDDPIIQEAYAKWLKAKRDADPSFLPDAPAEASKLNAYKYTEDRGQAMMLFMTEVERRSASRMIAYLRELGSKALFTNANNGPHPVSMQDIREEVYDYTDVHFYVDHPKFLERKWNLPSQIQNLNPVLHPHLNMLNPTMVRLADKPLVSTEWNFSGPGQYRGVGGIMTGAYGALQDWDGFWRFAYAHSARDVAQNPCSPGYFNVGTDPLGQASERASICLFLRRDIAPLADGVAFRLPKANGAPSERAIPVQTAWQWQDAGWSRRLATAATSTRIPAGFEEVPMKMTEWKEKTPPFATKPCSAVVLDREVGSFTINTPRTAGGFTPSGSIDAGVVRFTVSGGAATLWATSVDKEKTDIAHARRILVTHLTDVQADGNVYADREKTILLKWGKSRPIARTGRADVRLALASPEAYEVWALDTAGNRLAAVPHRVENGALAFAAEISAPSAVLCYEVIRK